MDSAQQYKKRKKKSGMIQSHIGLNSELQIRLHMLSGGYLPISSTSERMREQVKPFLLRGDIMKTCKKCGSLFDSRDCRVCHRKRSIAWNKENPEKRLKIIARYHEKYPEKQAARYIKYYAENKEKHKAGIYAWRANNIEAARIIVHNYRARKRANSGTLSKGLAEKLYKLQRGKCACCKQPLGDDYHMDHIMPIVRGGTNTDGNIQLLRAQCNMQKHAKHPIEFMQSRGFLL